MGFPSIFSTPEALNERTKYLDRISSNKFGSSFSDDENTVLPKEETSKSRAPDSPSQLEKAAYGAKLRHLHYSEMYLR
jgi:hypothetical protein